MESFVGVIDSGIGGLTVLQSLKNKNANICYVADHAYCPYGIRSQNELVERVSSIIEYLQRNGATSIILACNTASAIAPLLQQRSEIPIYEIISPTCKRVIHATATKRVALLATKLTVKSHAYQTILFRHDIKTICFNCSSFVPFVESGQIYSQQCADEVYNALKNLPRANVDTVILGCTHFPLLIEQISPYCSNAQIVTCCCDAPIQSTNAPDIRYLTTGKVETVNVTSARFGVTFEHIDI